MCPLIVTQVMSKKQEGEEDKYIKNIDYIIQRKIINGQKITGILGGKIIGKTDGKGKGEQGGKFVG